MVVLGAKRITNDIDIAVSEKLFNTLKKKSVFEYTNLGNDVYIYKNIEFATSFFDMEKTIEINGYHFANLEITKQLKQLLNRDKDKKDIKKIDLFLAMKDNHSYEKLLIDKGLTLICGVDEVGRGPLVGPVVAAAVILPLDFDLKGLTDSKKLSEKKREEYEKIIKEKCLAYSIGEVDNETIDKINIYEATKIAMKKAIKGLKIKPQHVLIDAMKLDIDIPNTPIIKGDIKSISISAASVIAKVYRDNIMKELDKKYPYYNFKNNKGYPTKEHVEAINKYGILDCYRKTYGPVLEYIKHNS